jgi:hypothetical protein
VSLAIKKSPPLTVIYHHSPHIVLARQVPVAPVARPTSHPIGAEKPVSFSITVRSVEFLTYN